MTVILPEPWLWLFCQKKCSEHTCSKNLRDLLQLSPVWRIHRELPENYRFLQGKRSSDNIYEEFKKHFREHEPTCLDCTQTFP